MTMLGTLLKESANVAQFAEKLQEKDWELHDAVMMYMEEGAEVPFHLRIAQEGMQESKKVLAFLESNNEKVQPVLFAVLKKAVKGAEYMSDPKNQTKVLIAEMVLMLAARFAMKKAGMVKGIFSFGLPKKPGTYKK